MSTLSIIGLCCLALSVACWAIRTVRTARRKLRQQELSRRLDAYARADSGLCRTAEWFQRNAD